MNNQKEIKIKAYRNAIYQGYLQDDKFDKIGAILSQDFFFCISCWNQNCLEGPSLVLFPDEKIFYGHCKNGYPQGLYCCEMGNQWQIYCTFVDKQADTYILAVFPNIRVILEMKVNQNGDIESFNEREWKTEQQRWKMIESLLDMKIPEKYYKFSNFISSQFLPHFNVVQSSQGQQYFVGFKGGGLGMKIENNDNIITSVGYYDQDALLVQIGKKLISRERRVWQQGIYSKPETLVRYQQRKRPVKKMQKIYQDDFKLKMDFTNQFLYLPPAVFSFISKKFDQLKLNIKDSATERVAQQLIEHLNPKLYLLERKILEDEQEQVLNKSFNLNDRDIIRSKKAEASLDQLKDQLEKSRNKSKRRKKSPYQQYDLSPAQLKYKSRISPNNKSSITTHPPINNYYNKNINEKNYESAFSPQRCPHHGKNNFKRFNIPHQPTMLNTDQTTTDCISRKRDRFAGYQQYPLRKPYPAYHKFAMRQSDPDQHQINQYNSDGQKYRYPLQVNLRVNPYQGVDVNKNTYKWTNPQKKNELLPQRLYNKYPEDMYDSNETPQYNKSPIMKGSSRTRMNRMSNQQKKCSPQRYKPNYNNPKRFNYEEEDDDTNNNFQLSPTVKKVQTPHSPHRKSGRKSKNHKNFMMQNNYYDEYEKYRQ